MSTNAPKKLFIKTWGCQMNAYDSNRMVDVLRPLGYTVSDTADDADMMILNTCHIREKATEKVFSDLGRFRELKTEREKSGKKTLIAVAGCVAQAEGDVITSRAPYVDMVFGPQSYHELPEMVARATNAFGTARIINTDFPAEDKFDLLPAANGDTGPSAFLSIQEGCDKFCTFCVVPYTRGGEYSRSVTAVMDEAKRMLDNGAVDITLLGQNVNAFHGQGPDGKIWGLGRLIEELAKFDRLKAIRYMTSHPRDCDDELVAAHRDIEKLMPFLHLPVQSGSDKILKAMNRKHTADDYRRIIEKFRTARPDMAFSSDFIIGFPGEEDADHQASMQLIRDIGFASAYSFKYSARPGTPAANMGGLVRPDIMQSRLHELQALLLEQGRTFNESFIGKKISVLFDRVVEGKNQLLGRTAYNQSVHTEGNPRLIGHYVDVIIKSASANALHGEIVTSEKIVKSEA